jgi:hypothetical protein
VKRGTIPSTVSVGNVSVLERLAAMDSIQPHAVLATESGGQPYTSLVAYTLTPDAKGVIFVTPKVTRKYKNILKNKRVSLLIDTRKNIPDDYLSAESITILGEARPVRKSARREKLAGIFTKKHARLKNIIALPETALILVDIAQCIHVTRFQSVTIGIVK